MYGNDNTFICQWVEEVKEVEGYRCPPGEFRVFLNRNGKELYLKTNVSFGESGVQAYKLERIEIPKPEDRLPPGAVSRAEFNEQGKKLDMILNMLQGNKGGNENV